MYQPVKSLLRAIPFTAAVLLFTLSACDKDDDDNKEKIEYTLSATLDGASEVPAVTSDGMGTMSGTYNKNTNMLTWSIMWHQLSGPATNMHFHGPAEVTEPAGVAIGIPGFAQAAEGTVEGSATITEEQEAELLGGKWYVNIHTDLNKAGEIRGQVSSQ